MKNPVKVFFSINPVSLTLYATLIVVLLFWIGVPLLDLIELKTYDIRFSSTEKIMELSCDRKMIALAVENVIKNSLDAIEKKGKIVITLQKVSSETKESSNSPSIKMMMRRAFAAETDTQQMWGLLQMNCLLVPKEERPKAEPPSPPPTPTKIPERKPAAENG